MSPEQAGVIAQALQAASLNEEAAQAVASALHRGLARSDAPSGSQSASTTERKAGEAGQSVSGAKGSQTSGLDKDKDADGEDTDGSEEVSDSEDTEEADIEREKQREEKKGKKAKKAEEKAGRKRKEKDSERDKARHKHTKGTKKLSGLAAIRAALDTLPDLLDDDEQSDTEEDSDSDTEAEADTHKQRARRSEGPSFASILATHKVVLPKYLRGLDRKQWMAPAQIEQVRSFGQTWVQFAAARDWERERNRRECHAIAMTIESILANQTALALEILTRRYEGVREADETGDWDFANVIGLASDLSSSLPAEKLEAIRKQVREDKKKDAAGAAARAKGGKKTKAKQRWAEGQAAAAGAQAAQPTSSAQPQSRQAGGSTRNPGGRPAA